MDELAETVRNAIWNILFGMLSAAINLASAIWNAIPEDAKLAIILIALLIGVVSSVFVMARRRFSHL